MVLSREVQRLQSKWQSGVAWPKRLDWIEIDAIRGWTGQRLSFDFPIIALVGENGVGKSTLLQAAASVYAPQSDAEKERFASDFFPATPWDQVSGAQIRYAVREGQSSTESAVRKPTDRWRGNPTRKQRSVVYIDLSRIQPVPARVGYSRMANPGIMEIGSTAFDDDRLRRLGAILGRSYDLAKMATTDIDEHRRMPVLVQSGIPYSGFHQGAGETTIAELLEADLPKYSLVLIDEAESSLHPRAQRRLIRDLADKCRVNELQVLLTTHSPYVLEELPPEARVCIVQSGGQRQVVVGVSSAFAMSKMDDVAHSECDVYVEDDRARSMVLEILTAANPDVVGRVQVVPFGAASVGEALGQMVAKDRFPRPTVVFLDGDRPAAPGCVILPGEDAPERAVFEALAKHGWAGVAARIGRSESSLIDASAYAMTTTNHHDWLPAAATALVLGSGVLWQAMCAEWAAHVLPPERADEVVSAVLDALDGIPVASPALAAPSDSANFPTHPQPSRPKPRADPWSKDTLDLGMD